MNKISDNLSSKFANMGFLFAMVVVFIHVPHYMTSSVIFLEDVFPGFLKSSANEWFFFAAGYFYAGHVNEPGWWGKSIVKRIRSLLVPYLVVNGLMLVLLLLYQRTGFCFPVDAKGSSIWRSIVMALGLGPCSPVDGPTWFVRSLILYVITAPLFIPLARRLSIAIPFVLVLFGMNIIGWDTAFSSLGGSVFSAFKSIYRPEHLVYFIAAIALRVNKCELLYRWTQCAGKSAAILSLLIGASLSIYAPMDAVDPRVGYSFAYNIARPLIMFGVFMLMPSCRWPKILTGSSFAIYILHWQLILMAYIISGKTGSFEIIFGNPVLLICYWAFVLVITICVASVIRKVKWIEMVMFGGR